MTAIQTSCEACEPPFVKVITTNGEDLCVVTVFYSLIESTFSFERRETFCGGANWVSVVLIKRLLSSQLSIRLKCPFQQTIAVCDHFYWLKRQVPSWNFQKEAVGTPVESTERVNWKRSHWRRLCIGFSLLRLPKHFRRDFKFGFVETEQQ